jgi:hypothetical protein
MKNEFKIIQKENPVNLLNWRRSNPGRYAAIQRDADSDFGWVLASADKSTDLPEHFWDNPDCEIISAVYRNFADWQEKYPRRYAIAEEDPENPGNGWILAQGGRPFVLGREDIRSEHSAKLVLLDAKIAKISDRKELKIRKISHSNIVSIGKLAVFLVEDGAGNRLFPDRRRLQKKN